MAVDKLVAFEVEEWERDEFARLEDDMEVVCTSAVLDADEASEHADADAITTFVHSQLPAEVLEQFDDLRLVATRSTGFEHIDLQHCEGQGITVCNVPTYGDNTVAEHVFGLLLTISHNLDRAIDRTRNGDFSLNGLRGFDLRGRTLGVVGTGDIGAHAIRIGQGFGMEAIAHDVEPREELADELGFAYVELDELLERSDVVTLHVPANEQTHHLLADDEFARMRPGAVLINTARGSVVDTRALLRALEEGPLAAAGLDVLPEEPTIREEAELLRSVYEQQHDLDTLLAGHVLLRMRNVVITPHSAFNTREAVQRIVDTTVDNIADFVAGEPRNVVVGSGGPDRP